MFADQTIELLPERTTMLTLFSPVVVVAPTINTQTSLALAIGGNSLLGRSNATAVSANFAVVAPRTITVVH